MPRLERDEDEQNDSERISVKNTEWSHRRTTDSSYLKRGDTALNEDDHPDQETHSEESQSVEIERAPEWGIFAHQVYQAAAHDRFDEVETEKHARYEDENGTQHNGRVDIVINENKLFDVKTHNGREWSEAEATRYGDEHGQQMRRYIDSPDTPDDSEGWIVLTVPPELEESREAYAAAAGAHGVSVMFSKSEQPSDVVKCMDEAVDEDDGDEVFR